MNLELLWPGGIGIGLGVVFSIVLGIYSNPTADTYTRELFGISSQTFLMYVTLFLTAFVIALFTAFSVLIRDSEYPTEHPGKFTLETFVVSAVPAAVIFIVAGFRGLPIGKKLFIEFGTLVVKFGLAHLLLQFSGMYSMIFNTVE
jgi:hypothetical protein